MSEGGIHNVFDSAALEAALVEWLLAIWMQTGEILGDVTNIDGDAMRGTDNATLQATWTDAMATALANYTAARAAYLDELDFDLQAALVVIAAYVDELETRLTAVRAGYLDELAAANLPSDIDDLLSNVAATAHHVGSRARVYPQDTQVAIQLTCSNAAPDTFGAWTQIVPINTIGFSYKAQGVQVEQAGAAATYLIQLGYSIVDGSDPTTEQIMGERRIVMLGTPIKTIHDQLLFYSFNAPANAKLWGRVKSSTGAADTIDISVVILRHVGVTNQVEPLTTWPWT